jgi:two-component system CheB/CheR fusion protein
MTVDSKMLDPQQLSHLLGLLAEQATEHAVILLDVTGRITWWNGGAERLFGQDCVDIVGQEFARIFTADDASRGIAALEITIAQSNAISEDDRWHVRADGSRFWATGALVPLRDSNGVLLGFGKIIRDRTNIKEQLVHLSKQVEAVTAADRSKEVGIATLAHELRNLLAAIFYGVRLLRSEGPDPVRRIELVELLEEHIEVIRRLTEDLLEVTRAQEGKISIQALDLALQEAVAKSIESCQARIADKQLRLKFLAARGPIVVHADAVRLHQVFGNLLDNAIKYTPAGGRIWVKVTTEDREAVVRIEDDGLGIPSHMLSQIFDLFTQVAEVSPQGLGIGLALVKNLVTLHGGSVQARSEGLGKGSEFTVRLPLKE